MNKNDFLNQFPLEERETLAQLAESGKSLQPQEHVIQELEMQLRKRFEARKIQPLKNINFLWQYLAGSAVVVALVLGMIWLVRSVAPEPRPPAAQLNATAFVCPVTRGNGSLPPGETVPSEDYLGNGQLWTSLWPDGKVLVNTIDNLESDGSYSMKWGWVRAVNGKLTIKGHRLDAQAEPLRASIPSGYGETGLQISALIFPTTGCWEVTGRVGDASLTFVTKVVLADASPTAQPAPTPTALAEMPVYERHGTTIYLAAEFPQEPATAGIYMHSPEIPASMEVARSLAQQFGIDGQVYRPDVSSPAAGELLVTDGKQRLYVSSSGRYAYSTGDIPSPSGMVVLQETAAPLIDSFLKSHGFNFDYQLEVANGMGEGWFYVIPLSLDGRPVRFDYVPQALSLQVSPQGQVISLESNLLSSDAQPVDQFDLISAGQAWQYYTDPATELGIQETFHGVSSGTPVTTWTRAYPEGVPVSLYGHIDRVPALEAGQPPFLMLESYTLSGKTTGMENVEQSVLVQAKGQFIKENGIRKFQVDEWQVLSQYGPSFLQDALQGSLRREDQKIIFTSNGTDYVLDDVPADLPLPMADVNVLGYLMEPKFEWQSITWFNGQSHGSGGGGGGGGNFAKLNLSGTPVPWPTALPPQAGSQADPTGQPVGQRLDGLQGLLNVNVITGADGSVRTEYGLAVVQSYYMLQGKDLSSLKSNNNRPVKVWGDVTGFSNQGTPIVSVERFEVPYPDLTFQILEGTQKLATLENQQVVLFTASDGKTYAQLIPIGLPDSNLIGVAGDLVEIEVLIIPGETLGGYPAMRSFSAGLAVNPKNGQKNEQAITADQPNTYTENGPGIEAPPPTLTIESIELVFFTSDPRYAASNPASVTPYIQPVWRFFGHYSTGDAVEILVQAVHREFLLPEPAPSVPLG